MDIYRSIAPFVLLKVVTLILCMFVPETITWLPHEIFGHAVPGG